MGDDERRTMVAGWLLGQVDRAHPHPGTALRHRGAGVRRRAHRVGRLPASDADAAARFEARLRLAARRAGVGADRDRPLARGAGDVVAAALPGSAAHLRRLDREEGGRHHAPGRRGRRALVGWLAGEPRRGRPVGGGGRRPRVVGRRAGGARHEVAQRDPRSRRGALHEPDGTGGATRDSRRAAECSPWCAPASRRRRRRCSATSLPTSTWATDQLVTLVEECREEALRPRPTDEPARWPDPPPESAGDPGGTRRTGVELLTWPH